MQARVSPTSPKYRPTDPVAKVWSSGELQQPARPPWGRMWLLILAVSLVVEAGSFAALGWYVRAYPHGWLTRWLPITTQTTTIVQPPKEKDLGLIPPTAVTALSQTAYAINADQGPTGVYTDDTVTGLAWPLNSGGWLLSFNGTLPADKSSAVAVPDVGQPHQVKKRLADPASPFIFLQSSDINDQPLSFAGTDQTDRRNKRVWVVGSQTAVSRQLINPAGPRWSTSDRLDQSWSLDAPTPLPAGAAVVDVDGRLLGLLDGQGRVWLTDSVIAILKQVIQQGTIERPTLGLTSLDRGAAVVAGDPTAAGALVGAADGQTAVTLKSPADKAGLKSGDIITAVNGQTVDRSLYQVMMGFAAGEKVTVDFRRGNQNKTTVVTLGSQRP